MFDRVLHFHGAATYRHRDRIKHCFFFQHRNRVSFCVLFVFLRCTFCVSILCFFDVLVVFLETIPFLPKVEAEENTDVMVKDG